MLIIINKNDSSLTLGDKDPPMLLFRGETLSLHRAMALFRDPQRFTQAGHQSIVVKEARIQGKNVSVIVTVHHDGSNDLSLGEPKLMVHGKEGFEPLPINSMNSAEAGQIEADAIGEFKRSALSTLIEAGLLSQEEAVRGGYSAEAVRRKPSGWRR